MPISEAKAASSCRLRAAALDDLSFLRQMLYEAAFWRAGEKRPALAEGLARPDLAKLLRGWKRRAGDTGVVAELVSGELIGAAWYRFWTKEDHSYGFVDPETPELAIAVVASRRGQGVGRALIQELLRTAAQRNVERLSLSVERDNPALRLYESLGFERAGTLGNAWTMVAATG